METIVISSDIVSFVFLTILLGGSLFGGKDRTKSTRLFIGCLLAAMAGTVADSFSYVVLDPGQYNAGPVFANMLSYVCTPLLFVLFTLYFFSVVEQKAAIPSWAIFPVIGISAADIILAVVGTINKKMTYMENGMVMDGEWTDYASILLFLGILYLYYFLFSYRKALNANQIMAFGGFLLFPIADSWITLFNTDIDFTYPIIALAFVVIYVIIQEHAVAEESLRRIVFEEDAFTDPQTGFKNNRAYEEALKAEERGRAMGVLCCNINHLDEIRETDGPDAVDKYLLKFDGILKDCFPGADICRISEKGFVAFLYKISEASFEKQVTSFGELMEQNDDMASFGHVYSDKDPLFDMVRDAELLV